MTNVDETPAGRVCTKCREYKILDEFSAAPRGRYGRKASCKACDAARHLALHPPKPRVGRPRRAPLVGSDLKTCTKCGVEKTIDEFSIGKKGNGATQNVVYKSQCKTCNSTQARQWYDDNKSRANENRRRFHLMSAYGLTVERFNAMVSQQNGVCAICGGKDDERLHVDHDHETGAIRGLLCNRCNRAIGLFGDDPVVMRRAIAYLMRAQRIHQETR